MKSGIYLYLFIHLIIESTKKVAKNNDIIAWKIVVHDQDLYKHPIITIKYTFAFIA